jgi:hypothetical protein
VVELVKVGIYCERCFRFVRYGREAKGGGLVWIRSCDWCSERLAKAEAEVAQLEALWRTRMCAAPDCSVTFAPAHPKQKFHNDRCRKRTHRR